MCWSVTSKNIEVFILLIFYTILVNTKVNADETDRVISATEKEDFSGRRKPWILQNLTFTQEGNKEAKKIPALKGEFPFAVLILLETDTPHMGVLTSPSWILSESTAIRSNKTDLCEKNVAYAGFVSNHLANNSDTQKRVITGVYVQPYRATAKSRRLVLFKIQSPFTFGEYITDIPVVNHHKIPSGATLSCVMLNWEQNGTDSKYTLYNRAVTLQGSKLVAQPVWNEHLLFQVEWSTECDEVVSAAVVCQETLAAVYLHVDNAEDLLLDKGNTECSPFVKKHRLFLFVGPFVRWMIKATGGCDNVAVLRKLQTLNVASRGFQCTNNVEILGVSVLLCGFGVKLLVSWTG